jgi:hypothetical protein
MSGYAGSFRVCFLGNWILCWFRMCYLTILCELQPMNHPNEPMGWFSCTSGLTSRLHNEQDATRARAQLDTFAAEHGLSIAATYVENESGAKLARPELFRLLSDAKPGDVLWSSRWTACPALRLGLGEAPGRADCPPRSGCGA